jgi:hypothetical protein
MPRHTTHSTLVLAHAIAAIILAAAAAATESPGSPCALGLQLHRQGRLDAAMQLYLQGFLQQQQQQEQQQQEQQHNAIAQHLAPCLWGAALAFWAIARSQPDEDTEAQWIILAHRSVLAHRRLLAGWDGMAPEPQQPSKQQRLLTCNGARGLADLHFDDSYNAAFFHPQRVHHGSIVFVNTFLTSLFFALHMPFVRAQFVLITGCSDDESPGEWSRFALDARLISWVAQNCDSVEPMAGEHVGEPTRKLLKLPIGLPNDYDDDALARAQSSCERQRAEQSAAGGGVVLGINEATHAERRGLTDIFKAKGLVTHADDRVGWEAYMLRMCLAGRAAAPQGNGLDTHRVWECAAVGCHPVVVATHPLLPMYLRHVQPLVFDNWHDAADELSSSARQLQVEAVERPPEPDVLKVTCEELRCVCGLMFSV